MYTNIAAFLLNNIICTLVGLWTHSCGWLQRWEWPFCSIIASLTAKEGNEGISPCLIIYAHCWSFYISPGCCPFLTRRSLSCLNICPSLSNDTNCFCSLSCFCFCCYALSSPFLVTIFFQPQTFCQLDMECWGSSALYLTSFSTSSSLLFTQFACICYWYLTYKLLLYLC